MHDDIIHGGLILKLIRANHSLHSTIKEIEMAVNNPQGHNQYTGHKKSSGSDADSKRSTPSNSASAGGTRGGTSEQHAEAGRQSHKNDDKSSTTQSGSKDSSSQTGRQNHKNDE